jgi:hypothetical protein
VLSRSISQIRSIIKVKLNLKYIAQYFVNLFYWHLIFIILLNYVELEKWCHHVLHIPHKCCKHKSNKKFKHTWEVAEANTTYMIFAVSISV